MRIGIVTQWFDPEPGPASLPGELARELVRRGHDVKVVTTFPNYPEGKVYDGYRTRRKAVEVDRGVVICRVGSFASHGDSAVGRIANYATFGASALVNAVDFLSDRDAVWVSNSPPTTGPLVRILRRRGIWAVVHVLDLWPDNIVSSGLVGSVAAAPIVAGASAMNAMLYGAADRVLTISPGVGAILTERGVPARKISYAPLWANESVFSPVSGEATRWALGVADETVVLLYAGSIGWVQGLDRLVQAIGRLPQQISDKLECWIVGDGVGLDALNRQVDALPAGSTRVRLMGRKPMSEMPELVAASDICYVSLQADDHARFSMPSKVQATLAMGRPLLASVPGDVDHLVRSKQLGYSVGEVDDTELASAISEAVYLGRTGLRQIGHHARNVYEQDFSVVAGTGRILTALRRDGGLESEA